MQNTITVEHTISMGHRLPSYEGICSSPHGHNVRVEVEILFGNQFIDFKQVQEALKSILAPMDHAMVLHRQDPLLTILQDFKFRTYTTEEEPTTEVIAWEVHRELSNLTKWNVIRTTVHETEKYSATVRR